MLADAAKEYLKAHPKATVVNLGCGADVSFPAIDNGQCQYINIDLPDVIAAREGMLGGVFYYFKDEQLKPLFCTMAEKFPGGALCFDCENSFGVRKANKMVHKSGNGSMMYFSVDNAEEKFLPWSKRFRTIRTINTLPSDITSSRELPVSAKLIIRLGAGMGIMKFVEIGF